MKLKKLPKIKCEIENCEIDDENALHYHHIVERKIVGTSNHHMNLACICANHHELTHSGRLKIIGVFPSTQPPLGRTLVYQLDGIQNIPGIDESYFKHQAPQMKIYNKEDYEKKEKK